MTPLTELIDRLDAPGLVWGIATVGENHELYPVETKAMAQAIPSRRAEFAAGRLAARRAMAAAGMPAQPIPMAADRSPVWPDGLCGSISHAGGYALGAVSTQPCALGLDLEIDQPPPAELAQTICHPGDDGDPLSVFCAKEAAYKAIYPQCAVLFGFDGLRVAGGIARLVQTPETRAIPPDLFRRAWPIQQIRASGMLLSLCVTAL